MQGDQLYARGLIIREFIAFTTNQQLPLITVTDIIQHHRQISTAVLEKLQPLPVFSLYLQKGYLPIITEGEAEYLSKPEQVINTIVDADLSYIASYKAGTAVKVKRLLGAIAESAPFKPNISALAQKLDFHRESVY